MVSDKKTDTKTTLERILRERLEQYDVPAEVRAALHDEITAFFERPEKKPYGAAVMTPEASLAADKAREHGENVHMPKPRIV